MDNLTDSISFIPGQHWQSKRLSVNHIILFLIWPLVSLYTAVRNYRSPYAMNLVWLFCGYFGLTFVFAEGSFADSSRIAMRLVNMHNNSTTFAQLSSSFYNPASGRDIDIVEALITFLVSRFTGDPRFLYMIFGLFFGYFYSRNIWFLIDRSYLSLNLFTALLVITFSTAITIWDINGFRFHAAAQVYMYGVLPYIVEGNKKKMGFVLFSLFIHWSFFLAVAIFFIYVLLRNRVHIYYILFVISFFISLLNLEIIRNMFENYAPDFVRETRSTYLDEGYKKAIQESLKTTNWYVQGHREALKWLVFLLLSFLYAKGLFNLRKNSFYYSLFNFTLLFLFFVNIFSVVPSIGRYYTVGNMCALAVLFLFFQQNLVKMPLWIRFVGIPAMLFYIVVRARTGMDFSGMLTFIGNPILAIFFNDNTPLIDFIKTFL